MTKKELIEILDQVDDDFEIKLNFFAGSSSFGWLKFDTFVIKELDDIGHSSKTISFDIEKTY